jgi:hypothetical protein
MWVEELQMKQRNSLFETKAVSLNSLFSWRNKFRVRSVSFETKAVSLNSLFPWRNKLRVRSTIDSNVIELKLHAALI